MNNIEMMIEQVAELKEIVENLQGDVNEIKKSNDKLIEYAETNEHLTEMMIDG